jgi:hypothetical protein
VVARGWVEEAREESPLSDLSSKRAAPTQKKKGKPGSRECRESYRPFLFGFLLSAAP